MRTRNGFSEAWPLTSATNDRARKWWDVDRPDFADVVPTTWAELEEKGLIRRHRRNNPPPSYELTEAGWLAGLRLAGAFNSSSSRTRCVELVKYFKSKVAGRRETHDAFVSHEEIARVFPFPWALNVLRSNLLGEMFPGKRMNARWDETQKIIRVPGYVRNARLKQAESKAKPRLSARHQLVAISSVHTMQSLNPGRCSSCRAVKFVLAKLLKQLRSAPSAARLCGVDRRTGTGPHRHVSLP